MEKCKNDIDKAGNISLSVFQIQLSEKFVKLGKMSTSHLLKASVKSFLKYLGKNDAKLNDITAENMMAYEQWLRGEGRMNNTISTYIRMIRLMYNRAVEQKLIRRKDDVFKNVFTKVEINHARAIDVCEIHQLLFTPVTSKYLRNIQAIAKLQYFLCGMPLVDVSQLERQRLAECAIDYYRRKTGVHIKIGIEPAVADLVSWWGRHYKAPNLNTPEGWQDYQYLLHSYNMGLKKLAQKTGVSANVSSYSLRHGWAQISKRAGIPMEMISEMLGHSSLETTKIYLKSFDENELQKANRRNIEFLCRRKKK